MLKQRFRRTLKWRKKYGRKLSKELQKWHDGWFTIPIDVIVIVQHAKELLAPIESVSFAPNFNIMESEDAVDLFAAVSAQIYENAYLHNTRTKILKGEITDQQLKAENFANRKEALVYINNRLNGHTD